MRSGLFVVLFFVFFFGLLVLLFFLKASQGASSIRLGTIKKISNAGLLDFIVDDVNLEAGARQGSVAVGVFGNYQCADDDEEKQRRLYFDAWANALDAAGLKGKYTLYLGDIE